MITNGRKVKCPTCGGEALETVHADDFEDTPASFSFTLTCKRGCPKQYDAQKSPQEMHERTNLPLSGWSNTKY